MKKVSIDPKGITRSYGVRDEVQRDFRAAPFKLTRLVPRLHPSLNRGAASEHFSGVRRSRLARREPRVRSKSGDNLLLILLAPRRPRAGSERQHERDVVRLALLHAQQL